LLGWGIYSTLLKTFGLPDVALLLSHPHDFYFRSIPNSTIHGLEKLALSRNSKRAFDYFEKMIMALKSQGYQFIFISELYQQIKDSQLQEFAWNDWK
jgi:hypothetical protein